MKFLIPVIAFLFIIIPVYTKDASINSALGLECYSCTTSCNTMYKVACPTAFGDYSCYSFTIQQNGRETYAKGCSIKDDAAMIAECETLSSIEGNSCYFCDTDLCNASSD